MQSFSFIHVFAGLLETKFALFSFVPLQGIIPVSNDWLALLHAASGGIGDGLPPRLKNPWISPVIEGRCTVFVFSYVVSLVLF